MNITEKRTVLKLLRRVGVETLEAWTQATIDNLDAPPESPTKEQFKEDWTALKGAEKAMRTARNEYERIRNDVFRERGQRYGRFVDSHSSGYTRAWEQYQADLAKAVAWRREDNNRLPSQKLFGHKITNLAELDKWDRNRITSGKAQIEERLDAAIETFKDAIRFLEVDAESEIMLGKTDTGQDLLANLTKQLQKILS